MIEYKTNAATFNDIERHIMLCSDDFVPPLGRRVDIHQYALKIYDHGVRTEAWDDEQLVGVVAWYFGKDEIYITSVSVVRSYRRKGIASRLVEYVVANAKEAGHKAVKLEVHRDAIAAIALYKSLGLRYCGGVVFGPLLPNDERQFMRLDLASYPMDASKNFVRKAIPKTRDYTAETRDTPGRKYAYSFDLDVMHPMMIRTFEPWFVGSLQSETDRYGSCLELGSYEGTLTKRLMRYFPRKRIVCIEASETAIRKAADKFGFEGAAFINKQIEDCTLKFDRPFDNIFCVHVLEHVDDPVLVLRRVNDEWLATGGRLFLAVPNANAASRQIAVHMGILNHCQEVTPDEAAQGHKRTFTLGQLEGCAIRAGLKVIYRGGIFLKALANFQLDKAKAAGIIDDAYLEGCFALGQKYPDLCASIFLICEKGETK
jgi:2-polyprenyl-3-methyl-5-hydroxy-6-metoxy-1,4-benzoquinol methylase/GNAT superfamily N-acetyltransferase